MVSIRFLVASIALLAVPLASAAPEPAEVAAPEPVEVYGCFAGGVTVVLLGQVVAQCVGGPLASASEADAAPYRVYGCMNGAGVEVYGVYDTNCIPVCNIHCRIAAGAGGPQVEVRQCALWGNSVAVTYGNKEIAESPCISGGCSPMCATAAEAVGGPRVEVTQCDIWGTGVAVNGREVVCLRGGCGSTCMTTSDAEAVAAPDLHFRTCSYHPPGLRLYNGDKPIGPCVLLPPPGVAAAGPPELFPLVRTAPCPEGQGSRIYLTGEGIQVTECQERSVASVDTHCNDPGNGVQVYVGGKAATTCIPLPHGV